MFLTTTLRRVPALVIDVRDWYAETFLTPGTVARPGGPVRVLATPTAPPDPDGWPFRGEAELVTQASPAGFVIFFDRARALLPPPPAPDPFAVVRPDPYSPGGGPLRRVGPPDATYALRLFCRGFQEGAVTVTLPAVPPTPPVPLLPGAAYPFPAGRRPNGRPGPTLLRGAVPGTDGAGVPGVTVTATSLPQAPPGLTDETGRWVLVLDPPDDPAGRPPAGPTDLLFRFPGGATAAVAAFPFAGGTTTTFPQTALRGAVRTADRRPVAGATVGVEGFAETSRSRSDGFWDYYLPLARRPAGGTQDVTVRAAAPDGREGTARVTLRFNTTTPVPPIIV